MDSSLKNKQSTYWKTELKKLKKYKSIVWFLLPSIILTIVFSYIPMLGILISFKADFNLYIYNPVQAFLHSTWTLSNYGKIFTDLTFIESIKNTLVISGLKILIVFPASIILAIMLSEMRNRKLSKLVLIILCLPQFLSWSVVIGIWTGLLSEVDGAINNLLVSLNIIDTPIWFFGSNALFKPLAIFLAGWKTSGWNSIMFYAAIISIDKSYYEAATIDGASKLKKIWNLTIPAIMPTIALMLVMNITYIMDAGFEQIYTMMNAETKYAQQILGTYLYDISIINRSDVPFATALGVFNGLIALSLMLIGNKVVKKTLGKSLW